MTAEFSLTFHVPPACQGQIVEYAYALDGENNLVVMRCHDRSDGDTDFLASKSRDGDEGDYWNGEPANDNWRILTDKELARYGLK